MDMSQYRDLFISESREYLRTINSLIVDLENDAGDREKIDSLFRAAHSIKGMAASMEYRDISELAHKLEDLMSRVRSGDIGFGRSVADLLLEGADLLEAMIADVAAGSGEKHDCTSLIARIVGYEPGGDGDGAPTGSSAESAATEEPQPAATTVRPETETRPESDRGRAESWQTVRVKTMVLDHLINITGELITNKQRLLNLSRDVAGAPLHEALTELSRLLRVLHNEVMNVRLMPLAAITDRFPRVVRDLAKKEGKELDFTIEGKDIELDRGIIEELSDPLVHILRNAVDHGIEPAEQRQSSGKTAKGLISLRARREKDQIIIVVEDDGRGMDPEHITAKAIEKGFLTPETAEQLSRQEALLLTCLPGFSTAGAVTDVSGRGVGMDAVRATIQALCGTLAIESEPGKGSRIILKLPPTVAIINVLLITTGCFTVAVPVNNVIRTLELKQELITNHGTERVFYLDDEPVPLVSLNRVFGRPLAPVKGESIPVFVSEVKGRKVGLVVDGFLGHQEVFLKPLGRPLDKAHGLAGSAILGDGEVIFILDVANLL
ncbi:MAG TPA: chemotaxis protein CheA [Geobacteraceae bacterium]